MQVQLPAVIKGNTQQGRCCCKEGGLFSGAGHLEDERCITSPSPWEDGRLMSQSPSPHLSGGRSFYKEGTGNRTKRSRKGVEKFSTCRRAQSTLIRQVMAWWASSWLGHPGLTSSWLYVTLAPRMKVSKSSGAGMAEGQSLYLLKLIARILIQTCCTSTSYTLVRASIYRNNVKRMLGWVTISHRYSFPLLQWYEFGNWVCEAIRGHPRQRMKMSNK